MKIDMLQIISIFFFIQSKLELIQMKYIVYLIIEILIKNQLKLELIKIKGIESSVT